MSESERILIRESIAVMNDLRADLSEFKEYSKEFRGEMREFKQTAINRIAGLEVSSSECQKNPTSCANARALDAHMKDHTRGKGYAVSVWAVCTSTVMCVFTIVMTLVKRS